MTYERTMPVLRRTLVIAAGEAAATVAGQTAALSREWLGVEPPLAVVNLPIPALWAPADAETQRTLADACDRLADADVAARLRQAGRALGRGDQITAWLLIQADAFPEPNDLPMQSAISLPGALAALIWQRLRSHVTVRALLLADPAAERWPAWWARRLAATGVEGIGLVGPVNAERLRQDAAGWQAQAAVALALCLWTDAIIVVGADCRPPSDGGPPSDGCPSDGRPPTADRPVSNVGADGVVGAGGCPPFADGCPPTVQALGAAAWPSPAAALRRLLIPRCAHLAAGRLISAPSAFLTSPPTPPLRGEGSSPPSLRGKGVGGLGAIFTAGLWAGISFHPQAGINSGLQLSELPALLVAPERHRLSLEAAVPPEPAGLRWGGRRPSWEALATLPETLRAQAEARSRKAHDEQFGPRMKWLEEQVARWQAGLTQLLQECLARPDGWPDLLRWREDLQSKAAELRAACAEIEERLEEAGGRFARAADETRQAEEALAALCRSFPRPGWIGALELLLAPWRWPGLAWAYLVRLPEAGQQYLDAHARQGAARWAEANLHALRQAYLAMAQMVQERERQAAAWIEAIEAAGRGLAQEVADQPAPPAPWDEQKLEALAEELAAGPGPGLSWLGAEATGAEDVRRGLIAWAEGQAAALDDLTAADWLALALDDEGLARWLGDRATEAVPLWPVVPPAADATTWLLCLDRTGPTTQADDVAAAERLAATLQERSAQGIIADGEVCFGVCGADVVGVLRTVTVHLTGEGV